MGLQCASFRCELDVDVRPPFSESAVACCLNPCLNLEPLHVHVQDSNTRRWAWPSSGIAQFGASFIHNHMKLSLSKNEQLLHLAQELDMRFTAVFRFLYRIWKWLCAPW